MGSKSWDIQPNRPAAARPVARPAPSRVAPAPPTRRTPPTRNTVPTRREAVRRAPVARPSGSLRERRRGARRKLFYMVGVGILTLLILVLILLWQPFLRVEKVVVEGPGSEQLPTYVTTVLAGTKYGVIPNNSIFFLSQEKLRADILANFPSIQAVSLKPSGLNTLTVTTIGRATAFWWCGMSYATQGPCFETDSEGKLFSPVGTDQLVASSSMLLLYAPLIEGSTSEPLGGTLASAKALPALLQFIKAMKTLNANVVAVDLRGDEADLYTPNGTRITYVLGREEQAAALATTAFPSLALNDGSLLYVDLRFDSKIFFKKKGELKK